MEKLIGRNYLHTHPHTETELNLDKEHVIVDKKELKEIQQFFVDNPDLIPWISKGKIVK